MYKRVASENSLLTDETPGDKGLVGSQVSV